LVGGGPQTLFERLGAGVFSGWGNPFHGLAKLRRAGQTASLYLSLFRARLAISIR
jgi:hypothetical protein